MPTGVAPLMASVDTVMGRRLVLILENIPMAEVQTIAVEYDYNAFPVVTTEGRLVGMITKGDLLRVARAALADRSVWREPVSRWMAHGVLALRPKDSLDVAVGHMVDTGLRSLPVIDEKGRAVGIVSRGDLLTAIQPERGT